MKIPERSERSGKMDNGLDRLYALDLPHIFMKNLEDPFMSKTDIHYLKNVRRLRTGSYFTATDGNGAWGTFELQRSSVLPTASTEYCENQKSTSEIFISVTKSGKPELITQKLTELGVSAITFFFSERSVPKWNAEKIKKNKERLITVSRSALAQSKGVWLPSLEIGGNFEEVILKGDIPLAHRTAERIGPDIRRIAIGPEGGWSDTELSSVHSKFSLHRSNLRSETAAITAAALLENI